MSDRSQYFREYYSTHKEQYNQYQTRWYTKNRDVILQKKKDRYANMDQDAKIELLNKRKMYYKKYKALHSKS